MFSLGFLCVVKVVDVVLLTQFGLRTVVILLCHIQLLLVDKAFLVILGFEIFVDSSHYTHVTR